MAYALRLLSVSQTPNAPGAPMSPNSKLAAGEGMIVGLYYTLKDDEGEVLDTNRKGGKPLSYLHGAQNIVPGLEKALEGKVKDDYIEVTVKPEDGYGERNDELLNKIERSALPPDADPQPGMQISGQNEQGQPVAGLIADVDDEHVTVDFNHPLAGHSLHFEVTIAGVREASDEEKQHGHAHGPGGHEH